MLDVKETYKIVRKFYSHERTLNIIRLEKRVDKLESIFFNIFRKKIYEDLSEVAKSIKKGEPKYTKDFTDIVLKNYLYSYWEGIISSKKEKESTTKLAKKKIKTKSDLEKEIAKIKNGKKKLTPEQKKTIEGLKREYYKSIEKTFKTAKEENLSQEDIESLLRKNLKSTESYSDMVVRTETTRYYNQARVDAFSQDELITHYQFLAIRDKRTTEWCKDRNGLVYEKKLIEKINEVPPIHWNCRSKISPLDIFDPEDKKLIENKSLWRQNNSCKKLPNGWKKF